VYLLNVQNDKKTESELYSTDI